MANTVHDFLNSCTITESHKPPSRRSIAMYQTTTSSIRTSGVDEHVRGVAGDPRRALPDIVHGVSEMHHHTAWNRRALGMRFFLNPKNVWFRLHLYKDGVVGWFFLVRSFPLLLVSCCGHFFHIDRAVTEKLPCVKYVWATRHAISVTPSSQPELEAPSEFRDPRFGWFRASLIGRAVTITLFGK
jgi:hypothetical protein